MMAILTSVRCCLLVVLICVSLIPGDVGYRFMAFWPSVCLLWRTSLTLLLIHDFAQLSSCQEAPSLSHCLKYHQGFPGGSGGTGTVSKNPVLRVHRLYCLVPLLLFNLCVCISGLSLLAQIVKNLPANAEMWVQSLGWEDPLKKEMANL